MAGDGYHVVYDVHKNGIPLGDIPQGQGGTDALMFVSIIRGGDGSVSYAITGVDGQAPDKELSAQDRWKVWLHIAHSLMEDKTLDEGKRVLCRQVFKAVQQSILENRRREETDG